MTEPQVHCELSAQLRSWADTEKDEVSRERLRHLAEEYQKVVERADMSDARVAA